MLTYYVWAHAGKRKQAENIYGLLPEKIGFGNGPENLPLAEIWRSSSCLWPIWSIGTIGWGCLQIYGKSGESVPDCFAPCHQTVEQLRGLQTENTFSSCWTFSRRLIIAELRTGWFLSSTRYTNPLHSFGVVFHTVGLGGLTSGSSFYMWNG